MQEDTVIGLYSLGPTNRPHVIELENFWLLPKHIGTGLGRTMFEHMHATATDAGAQAVFIVSDPNAEDFYLKMGAHNTGTRPSSIPDRTLPTLELSLH